MKTIGLIGGMSWESTATYYRLINQGIKAELGGLHSAKIVMVSVDFAEIEALQTCGDWSKASELLIQAAISLQSAGADFFLICTNTMHKMADQIQSLVCIPLLHIADATADRLLEHGMTRVGLLGTAFTMEQAFYKSRLSDVHGLNVMTPDQWSREVVHRVIYDELCLNHISDASRRQYLGIINNLSEQGAQAIVLGCTEISMLIRPSDTAVRLYDTTDIHAQAAVRLALNSSV